MNFSAIFSVLNCLALAFYGRTVDEENVAERSVSSLSKNCCDRIENQITILKDTTKKLIKDVGEITIGIEDDIPPELRRQAVELKKVSSEMKRQTVDLEELSSELKGVKSFVGDISISLNRYTNDLLIHDARMKEQGLLLSELRSLVNEIHDSLIGPKDCLDIGALGHRASGVYRVYPGSLAKRIQTDAYCDMTTPGGNWLVFQRRKDGSVNFEQTWIEYENGFGNPSGEFWLGNKVLYLLTSNRNYKLRIDMEDFDGKKRYAEYSTFSVSSSADRYRLTVSGYTGNAGDSFSRNHSGMQFSTKDADNDIYSGGSCSLLYHGAWWYARCHESNLNGLYLSGVHKSYGDGVQWIAFYGDYHSLKTTEMKIAIAN